MYNYIESGHKFKKVDKFLALLQNIHRTDYLLVTSIFSGILFRIADRMAVMVRVNIMLTKGFRIRNRVSFTGRDWLEY